MEKKSNFNKIITGLCLIALLITAVETNQIRLQTKLAKEETLVQKFMYNFPTHLKLGQKYTNRNNVEFVVKDKNFSDKISAPVVKTTYDYWGDAYTHQNSYTPKDSNNKLVYVNVNIKSLNTKKSDINDLVKSKIIFDKKYEFDCFTAKTTKDKTNFTTEISLMPLQSEDVYFISELPKEFVDSEKPLSLELKIANNKYVMDLR